MLVTWSHPSKNTAPPPSQMKHCNANYDLGIFFSGKKQKMGGKKKKEKNIKIKNETAYGLARSLHGPRVCPA